MANHLNSVKLAACIKAKRGATGLRISAEEIGKISASTLSRVEQGKLPDVDTFIRICKWLKMPLEDFIVREAGNFEAPKPVLAHLRAKKTMESDVVEALVNMVTLAFRGIK